ncbi:hypothetical protein [Niveispirillum sp.]|uniref:hypothetical protein n=1 Tax=Niveispirillum sp. TaxID=1917217 RepID=UPI001B440DB4|nr:hypothetical protein [Niveispirillum sp.]MBP7339635.1 hypothetical protein [Niveispirillum sp.]
MEGIWHGVLGREKDFYLVTHHEWRHAVHAWRISQGDKEAQAEDRRERFLEFRERMAAAGFG